MNRRKETSKQTKAGRRATGAIPESPEQRYKRVIHRRFWMVLNYLSVPASVAIVYAFSALCEYGLFRLVWWLLTDEIRALPVVAIIAEYTQIGVFAVSMLAALIHSGFSLWGTYQVERQFAKEDE